MANRIPLWQRAGLIACVSGDRSTYPQFCTSMMALRYPPGSAMEWRMSSGGTLAIWRSELVLQAVQRGAGWVWMIDDDHVFSTYTLIRLLAHDRDVVCPLVASRKPPFNPLLWKPYPIDANLTDEELAALYTKQRAEMDQRAKRNGDPYVSDLPDIKPGQNGLVEVGYAGAGGVLMSLEAITAVTETGHQMYEFGRLGVAGAEDTWASLLLRRAGFQIWCDLGTPIGHLTTFAVWPKLQADGTIVPDHDTDFRLLAAEERLKMRYIRRPDLPGIPPQWTR